MTRGREQLLHTDGAMARILVVDDLETNQHLLRRLIEAPDYDIEFASNGRRALAMLAERPFDLVVLDIMMPIMNGYETLLQIKADEQLRHIPVVIVSALSEMENVVRCIEAGAEDYLTKPFERVLLRARIAASLERKRYHDREQQYLQIIQGELAIGQRIQADFLPRELPVLPGWDIAAAFHPAHQVAGDFYDVFFLPGGRIAVVIADVCDKGIGAALFMALVRTLLRVFAETARPERGEENLSTLPRPTLGALTAVRRTNDYVIDHHIRTNMFASLFFGVIDPDRCTLAYVNAGHDPPFHVGPGGAHERLSKTGPAVGTLRGATYTWREVEFAPGDVLLAYTDGVTDARDPNGAFYTDRRLGDIVTRITRSATASDILASIEDDVARFTGGATPADDVTLLALRRALMED